RFDYNLITIFYPNYLAPTIPISSHQNRSIPNCSRLIWFVLWRIHYSVHKLDDSGLQTFWFGCLLLDCHFGSVPIFNVVIEASPQSSKKRVWRVNGCRKLREVVQLFEARRESSII